MYLTQDEIARILYAIKSYPRRKTQYKNKYSIPLDYAARDEAYIRLLICAALRPADFVNLTAGQVLKLIKHGKIPVIGKGDKEAHIWFVDRIIPGTAKMLNDWIELNCFRKDDRFAEVSVRELEHLWDIYTRLAGIKPKKMITPQKSRHTLATFLGDNRVPVEVVKEVLRHDNIATTLGFYETITPKAVETELKRRGLL